MANDVELTWTPLYASSLNRIEAQFQALRYLALDGTEQPRRAAPARMIRRCARWRNTNPSTVNSPSSSTAQTLADAYGAGGGRGGYLGR